MQPLGEHPQEAVGKPIEQLDLLQLAAQLFRRDLPNHPKVRTRGNDGIGLGAAARYTGAVVQVAQDHAECVALAVHHGEHASEFWLEGE